MDLLKGEKVIQLKLGPFNDPDLTWKDKTRLKKKNK